MRAHHLGEDVAQLEALFGKAQALELSDDGKHFVAREGEALPVNSDQGSHLFCEQEVGELSKVRALREVDGDAACDVLAKLSAQVGGVSPEELVHPGARELATQSEEGPRDQALQHCEEQANVCDLTAEQLYKGGQGETL